MAIHRSCDMSCPAREIYIYFKLYTIFLLQKSKNKGYNWQSFIVHSLGLDPTVRLYMYLNQS